jgi:hypothetical protein
MAERRPDPAVLPVGARLRGLRAPSGGPGAGRAHGAFEWCIPAAWQCR